MTLRPVLQIYHVQHIFQSHSLLVELRLFFVVSAFDKFFIVGAPVVVVGDVLDAVLVVVVVVVSVVVGSSGGKGRQQHCKEWQRPS